MQRERSEIPDTVDAGKLFFDKSLEQKKPAVEMQRVPPTQAEVQARQASDKQRRAAEAELRVQAWFDAGMVPAERERGLEMLINDLEEKFEEMETEKGETTESFNRRSEEALAELNDTKEELSILRRRLREMKAEQTVKAWVDTGTNLKDRERGLRMVMEDLEKNRGKKGVEDEMKDVQAELDALKNEAGRQYGKKRVEDELIVGHKSIDDYSKEVAADLARLKIAAKDAEAGSVMLSEAKRQIDIRRAEQAYMQSLQQNPAEMQRIDAARQDNKERTNSMLRDLAGEEAAKASDTLVPNEHPTLLPEEAEEYAGAIEALEEEVPAHSESIEAVEEPMDPDKALGATSGEVTMTFPARRETTPIPRAAVPKRRSPVLDPAPKPQGLPDTRPSSAPALRVVETQKADSPRAGNSLADRARGAWNAVTSWFGGKQESTSEQTKRGSYDEKGYREKEAAFKAKQANRAEAERVRMAAGKEKISRYGEVKSQREAEGKLVESMLKRDKEAVRLQKLLTDNPRMLAGNRKRLETQLEARRKAIAADLRRDRSQESIAAK